VFFLGALLGAAAWIGFDYGREWAGLSAGETSRSVRRLRSAVKELEKERDELRQQLVALERSGQIDREATRLAQMELARLQDQRQELEKEVEFLRNLVEEGATGALKIKDFNLSSTDQQSEFEYRFTVSQSKEDFGWTKGNVLLKIVGSDESGAKTLDLQEVSADSEEAHKIKFRHFQNIKGLLRLPEGFSPDSVSVEVKPTVKKLAPLSESFDWVVEG
jgi:hypothetical protein